MQSRRSRSAVARLCFVQGSESTAQDPGRDLSPTLSGPDMSYAKGAHNQTATHLEDGISRRTAAIASLGVGRPLDTMRRF
jgi:hypothetical protein